MIERIAPGRSPTRGTRYSSRLSLVSSPSTSSISSNSALPMPWSVAPSSWRSTSCGLIALPTSATVAVRSTLIDAGVRVDLDLGGGDADLPEVRPLGVGAGVAAARADLAALDDLAAAEAEALGDHVGEWRSPRPRMRRGRRPARPPAGRRPTPRPPSRAGARRPLSAARLTARPATVVERLAPVERS